MQGLFDAFSWVLAVIYDVVPNYGVAIMLLTLVVMLATTPLTLKSTRSMMVMQKLQPEIKKIQSRYKDDRQKQNEELLKFYKENEINPLGGCLPLLVQMPMFIVLYGVLRGLTRRVSDVGFSPAWVGGQLSTGASPTKPPLETYQHLLPFDPAYLSHDSKLYQSLSGTDTMSFLGMDLASSASQVLSRDGIVTAAPYLLLIAIVGLTGYVQQKQIAGRNKGAEQNPQQQMMMKIFPIFLPVISYGLPLGLVLYFAVSNIYRVGQQWFISRNLYGAEGDKSEESRGSGGSAGGGDRSGPGPKGGPGKASNGKGGGATAKVMTSSKGTSPGRGSNPKAIPAGKAKSGTGAGATKARDAKPGSSTKTTKSTDRPKQQSSRTSAPPRATLQPRARKPKKR